MPTQEERLSILEQTLTSLRNEFLQAITENTLSMGTLNKVILRQEQNVRDANHAITILTGVISSQGQDIKNIKNRLDDFEQHFASLEEKLDRRFTSVEGRLEQVLLLLTRLTPKLDQET